MTDYLVSPLPGVVISDSVASDLPILTFNCIVVVEPDPQTWMSMVGDNLEIILDYHRINLSLELDNESELYFDESGHERIENKNFSFHEPQIIWISYDVNSIFADFRDGGFFQNYPNVIFRLIDYDDFDHLNTYLIGLKSEHSEWTFAVVGGILEDDVVRISNLIYERGFAVTVLTRHCMSRGAFVNLDEFAVYKAWLDSFRGEADEEGF